MAGLDHNAFRTSVGAIAMFTLPFWSWTQVSLQPDTTTLKWGERVQSRHAGDPVNDRLESRRHCVVDLLHDFPQQTKLLQLIHAIADGLRDARD